MFCCVLVTTVNDDCHSVKGCRKHKVRYIMIGKGPKI